MLLIVYAVYRVIFYLFVHSGERGGGRVVRFKVRAIYLQCAIE